MPPLIRRRWLIWQLPGCCASPQSRALSLARVADRKSMSALLRSREGSLPRLSLPLSIVTRSTATSISGQIQALTEGTLLRFDKTSAALFGAMSSLRDGVVFDDTSRRHHPALLGTLRQPNSRSRAMTCARGHKIQRRWADSMPTASTRQSSPPLRLSSRDTSRLGQGLRGASGGSVAARTQERVL